MKNVKEVVEMIANMFSEKGIEVEVIHDEEAKMYIVALVDPENKTVYSITAWSVNDAPEL